MPTFRRIRCAVAAVLLVLYLPGCYSWVTPKGMTPQEYIAAKHPGHVRLTFGDSSRTELLRPSVAGDSLTGFLAVPVPGGWKKGEVVSVPSGAVLRLEVGSGSEAEGVGIIMVVLLVGGFVGFVAGMSGMYGG